MTAIRWILALAVGLFLIAFGAMKFTGDNPIFAYIAFSSGIGLFEPVVRMAVGAAEIVAGAALIYPRTRGLGAVMATGVVAGALVFHLSPWLGINAPTGFAEGATAPYEVAADFAAGTPVLFFMACGVFAAAAVSAFLERERLSALLGAGASSPTNG